MVLNPAISRVELKSPTERSGLDGAGRASPDRKLRDQGNDPDHEKQPGPESHTDGSRKSQNP